VEQSAINTCPPGTTEDPDKTKTNHGGVWCVDGKGNWASQTLYRFTDAGKLLLQGVAESSNISGPVIQKYKDYFKSLTPEKQALMISPDGPGYHFNMSFYEVAPLKVESIGINSDESQIKKAGKNQNSALHFDSSGKLVLFTSEVVDIRTQEFQSLSLFADGSSVRRSWTTAPLRKDQDRHTEKIECSDPISGNKIRSELTTHPNEIRVFENGKLISKQALAQPPNKKGPIESLSEFISFDPSGQASILRASSPTWTALVTCSELPEAAHESVFKNPDSPIKVHEAFRAQMQLVGKTPPPAALSNSKAKAVQTEELAPPSVQSVKSKPAK